MVYAKRKQMVRRRRKTTKRKKTKRVVARKRSPPMSKEKMELARLIRNPFSITSYGRIPDGRCHMSDTVKAKAQKKWLQQAGTIDIMFYPGVNNMNTFQIGNGTQGMPLCGMHKMGNASGVQKDGNQISQWRLVSAAMRITLINNSTNNAGYFETIRFTLPHEWAAATWRQDGEGTPGEYYSYFDRDNRFGSVNGPNAFVCDPTYTQGRLRDIDDCLFTLKPISDVRDLSTLKTGAQGNEAHRGIDPGFDCVWVRIHGVENVTEIITHTVGNFEVVYDQNALNASSMQKANHHKAVESYIEQVIAKEPMAPYKYMVAGAESFGLAALSWAYLRYGGLGGRQNIRDQIEWN